MDLVDKGVANHNNETHSEKEVTQTKIHFQERVKEEARPSKEAESVVEKLLKGAGIEEFIRFTQAFQEDPKRFFSDNQELMKESEPFLNDLNQFIKDHQKFYQHLMMLYFSQLNRQKENQKAIPSFSPPPKLNPGEDALSKVAKFCSRLFRFPKG